VPQRRERAFVVGVRADLGIEYSFPVQTHSREALWFDQWVSGAYWERHAIAKIHRPNVPESVSRLLRQSCLDQSLAPWRTVRDAIGDLPNVGVGQTSNKVANHFLNPGARTYEGHDGSIMDAPAKTVKAGQHGVSGGENVLRLDDDTVRYFSVRECARLQSFPDDWVFEGSWSNCMRQIGNAVPVVLGERVALPFAEVLLSRLG
jgi:DNA (cytosine-5)-methyltransferase 1